MAHRIISTVALTGLRVVGRAFAEAYRQAAAASAYQRAHGGGAAPAATARAHAGLTLDEACRILNVKPSGGREALVARAERLFAVNDPKKGGSFYLQSKIHRARERLEAELAKAAPPGRAAVAG